MKQSIRCYVPVSVEDKVSANMGKDFFVIMKDLGLSTWVRHVGKQTDEQFKNVLRQSGVTHWLEPKKLITFTEQEWSEHESVEQDRKEYYEKKIEMLNRIGAGKDTVTNGNKDESLKELWQIIVDNCYIEPNHFLASKLFENIKESFIITTKK